MAIRSNQLDLIRKRTNEVEVFWNESNELDSAEATLNNSNQRQFALIYVTWLEWEQWSWTQSIALKWTELDKKNFH